MELSLARLINFLVSKPDLLAEVSGNVEKALSLGGISPTHENKAAVSAALQMLARQHDSTVMAKPDITLGWDGGDGSRPIMLTPTP
jgi:hypothetical protein